MLAQGASPARAALAALAATRPASRGRAASPLVRCILSFRLTTARKLIAKMARAMFSHIKTGRNCIFREPSVMLMHTCKPWLKYFEIKFLDHLQFWVQTEALGTSIPHMSLQAEKTMFWQ